MAKPNKMGMNAKQLRESRAARFGRPMGPPVSDSGFQGVLDRLQKGDLTPKEAEDQLRKMQGAK